MAVEWTREQKRAIDCPIGKGNILVSAAAGSGKTAVLVERILKNVVAEGTDIDKFLVVTFTKAAAAGMKQKIRNELAGRFDAAYAEGDTKTADFMARQLELTSSADITTIDAFCLKVVKNNFHYLGIDPNFKNIDGEENDIICDSVMDALFERLYDEHDESFLRLVDRFASYRNDYMLIEMVKGIYKFTENFAEPDKWLDEKCAMYDEDMSKSVWVQEILLDSVKEKGREFAYTAETILNDIAYFCAGEMSYFENREYISDEVRELCDSEIHCVDALEEIYNVCADISKNESPFISAAIISDIPEKKNAKWKPENKVFFDRTRELLKEFDAFLQSMAVSGADELNRRWHSRETKAALDDICRLVKSFRSALWEEKSKRNAWSFSDIEHMTFELFDKNEAVQKNSMRKYREILIDEYQDTNELQDGIFTRISGNKKNIFMVGDLKQSIYGFRGGDPYIFKKKNADYSIYKEDEKGDKKIILSRNFRSRPEVLDSVNELFGHIMSDAVGDVVYNDDESLHYSADLPKTVENEISYKSEFHMVINGDKKNMSNGLCEARYIASKIKELIGKIYFDGQKYVTISYKDITVLTRSVTGAAADFTQAFEEAGIPLFIETDDYFKRREISAVLALLSVIANHKQDIPLIEVMRSPMFGFSYDELAKIRIEFGVYKSGKETYKRRYFYDCVRACAKDEGDVGRKCAALVSSLERWRDFVRKRKVSELIWTIYEETAFYDFLGALEGGEQAQANLRLLYERARAFEAEQSGGLFAFINYIERIRESGAEQSPEGKSGADCVTMTTSHKSKGLEYPIVFLAGAGKGIRSVQRFTPVQMHKDLGIGLAYHSKDPDCFEQTFCWNYIRETKKNEGISEIMRLLYVALTRPKYKLYVTAAVDESKECKSDVFVDERYIRESNGIYLWMKPAVERSKYWKYTEYEYIDEKTEAEQEEEKAQGEYTLEEYEKLRTEVDVLLSRRYKYESISMIPSRTTATELKKLRQEEDADNLLSRSRSGKGMKRREFNLTEAPEFADTKISAARVGTVYHQIMANIDLDKMKNSATIESVARETERILSEGGADAQAADKAGAKMAEDICNFFNSDIGKQLTASGEVNREKSFQTYIDAGIYNSSLGSEEASEKIMLQGIIDCMFTDSEGRCILLDYKTDKCSMRNYMDVVERYRIQLELYSLAIEKIMGIKVYKKYLYLFDISKCVEVE
ncbi:MAG: UvrD-helicase domain-containing protein [Clostridiales bacterium]|nr:UvrD-helicase domain-containing protein [Clostridiales bacterium]